MEDISRPLASHLLACSVFLGLCTCRGVATMLAAYWRLPHEVTNSTAYRTLLMASAMMACVFVAAHGFINLHAEIEALRHMPLYLCWWLGFLASTNYAGIKLLATGSRAVVWARTP